MKNVAQLVAAQYLDSDIYNQTPYIGTLKQIVNAISELCTIDFTSCQCHCHWDLFLLRLQIDDEGLSVQIPAPTVRMLKCPWARCWVLNCSQWGSADTLNGSSHPLVDECVCEWEASVQRFGVKFPESVDHLTSALQKSLLKKNKCLITRTESLSEKLHKGSILVDVGRMWGSVEMHGTGRSLKLYISTPEMPLQIQMFNWLLLKCHLKPQCSQKLCSSERRAGGDDPTFPPGAGTDEEYIFVWNSTFLTAELDPNTLFLNPRLPVNCL